MFVMSNKVGAELFKVHDEGADRFVTINQMNATVFCHQCQQKCAETVSITCKQCEKSYHMNCIHEKTKRSRAFLVCRYCSETKRDQIAHTKGTIHTINI
jgi:predicted sulfurtransferase